MTRRIKYSKNVGAVGFEPTNPSLVRRKQPTKRSSSQSRVHPLDLRKPCPEMPGGAWDSLHGGSRKWFPEQRPRSPESGTEQRLLDPLPITGTSAPTGLKHQVRTAARPSMPKPGQDSRQRHRPNSDRHEEWTPRSVDKRVLPADSGRPCTRVGRCGGHMPIVRFCVLARHGDRPAGRNRAVAIGAAGLRAGFLESCSGRGPKKVTSSRHDQMPVCRPLAVVLVWSRRAACAG